MHSEDDPPLFETEEDTGESGAVGEFLEELDLTSVVTTDEDDIHIVGTAGGDLRGGGNPVARGGVGCGSSSASGVLDHGDVFVPLVNHGQGGVGADSRAGAALVGRGHGVGSVKVDDDGVVDFGLVVFDFFEALDEELEFGFFGFLHMERGNIGD